MPLTGPQSNASLRADRAHRGTVGDCLKELDETSYWHDLLVRGEVVAEAKLASHRADIQQLRALFAIIAKTAKR